jgi:C4-type Zn-finger protein
MSDYDSWKLATPLDDEVAMTVSFDCSSCEYYNDDVDAIGSRGSDEVIVYCYECDAENTVDVGE